MRQFVAYLCVGGVAALLNWSSRFLFSYWFSYTVAIILAFFVGLVAGFAMMRWFVFDAAKGSVALQIPAYVLVNAVALLQTLAVSLIFAKYVIPHLGLPIQPEGPAHLIGILTPVFTSYFGHKHLTFRSAARTAIGTANPARKDGPSNPEPRRSARRIPRQW